MDQYGPEETTAPPQGSAAQILDAKFPDVEERQQAAEKTIRVRTGPFQSSTSVMDQYGPDEDTSTIDDSTPTIDDSTPTIDDSTPEDAEYLEFKKREIERLKRPRVPIEDLKGREIKSEPTEVVIPSDEVFRMQYAKHKAEENHEIKAYGKILNANEKADRRYLENLRNQGGYRNILSKSLSDARKNLNEQPDRQAYFEENILPDLRENSPTEAAIFDFLGATGYDVFLGSLEMMMTAGGAYNDAVVGSFAAIDDAIPGGLAAIPGLRHKTIKGNAESFIRESNLFFLGTGDYGGVADLVGASMLAGEAARQIRSQVKKGAKHAGRVEKLQKRMADPTKAKTAGQLTLATIERTNETRALAQKVASENQDIAEQLLKDAEVSLGVRLTREVDGRLVYDPDAARAAGKDITEEIAVVERKLAEVKKSRPIVGRKTAEQVELEKELFELRQNKELFHVQDGMTSPILNPDKFDAIVAVASDLKAKNPKAFDSKKTLIDNLFDLTVKGDLTGDNAQDLMNTLGQYGLTFDDYVLTVVSGGSEAGKILNKLSQLRRVKTDTDVEQAAQKATVAAQGNIRNFIMRVENIRRGLLVSQLKTAVRNLSSAYIRSPLEAVQSIMDTSLKALAEEGVAAGAKALVSKENWIGSLRMLKYIYGDAKTARTYADWILERPQLANQMDRMYNNLNEIQIATGRGSGTITDKVLSGAEDLTMALNIPNRWQEMVVRRGVFFGELQRLTKREYGIDLMEAVNQGQINDLLNDAPGIRPKGSRSFIDLVADSTDRALDITYAKQPDVPPFQTISSFITRNGLTVVAPFPRFMFNSMELIGQYAGGASIPLTKFVNRGIQKRVFGKEVAGQTAEQSAKMRQQLSRNAIGASVIVAAFMYRDSEDAPPDYKNVRTNDGVVMDVSPQFPLRQLLFIGEAAKQAVRYGADGFAEWMWENKDEFLETFAQPLRSGVGASFVDEFLNAATIPFSNANDLVASERVANITGRAIGNYLRTWAVPLQQLPEWQRITGARGVEYKDVAKDPTLELGTSFTQEIGRTFDQSGITLSAEEEAKLPKRSGIFTRPDAKRIQPLLSFTLGINLKTEDTEAGQYLKDLGFKEWNEGSKSKVPSIKRLENNILKVAVPTIAEKAKTFEKYFGDKWEAEDKDKHPNKNYYVRTMVRNEVEKDFRKIRGKFAEGSIKKKKVIAAIEEDDPDITKAAASERALFLRSLMAYRRVAPKARKAALLQFRMEFDRPPDVSDSNDLFALAELAGVLKRSGRKRGRRGRR